MGKMILRGICDDEFIRGDVPMTKEEVRELSVYKMHLLEDSVVYDIGCGTGSVSIEMALLSEKMKVYSIEVNPEAVVLTKKNIEKFAAGNIEVVEGMAPESFSDLPAPTHCFIGGSKGNLKSILSALYEKNNSMRIVMNAVSLESVAEMNSALKEFPVCNEDVVQVSVSKVKKTGNYSMLQANNPVFIFSFDFAGEKQS